MVLLQKYSFFFFEQWRYDVTKLFTCSLLNFTLGGVLCSLFCLQEAAVTWWQRWLGFRQGYVSWSLTSQLAVADVLELSLRFMESAVLFYCLQPCRWKLTVVLDVGDVPGLSLGLGYTFGDVVFHLSYKNGEVLWKVVEETSFWKNYCWGSWELDVYNTYDSS